MIKCPKCGMKVDENSKFCTCCGSLMPADAPIVTETPAPSYAAPVEPAPAANSMQGRDPFGAPPVYQAPAAPAPSPLTPITPLPDAEPQAAPQAEPVAAAEPAPAPQGMPAPAPAPQPVVPAAVGAIGSPTPQLAPIISTGHWLGTMILLTLIPLLATVLVVVLTTQIPAIGSNQLVCNILNYVPAAISLIMILVWAFSSRTNPSKRNFFRACLIYTLIMIVLLIALVMVAIAMLPNLIGELEQYMQIFYSLGI